jgi:Ca2+-binding RTX toxin-like protein
VDAAVGAADVIYGGAGDDWIGADQGNDIVDAGADNDVVFGGSGADVILGQGGNDVLIGNRGYLSPEKDGDDYIDGGDGNDKLWGAGDNDTLVSVEAARKVLDIVSSKDKEFRVVPGGHAGVFAGSKAPDRRTMVSDATGEDSGTACRWSRSQVRTYYNSYM